MTGRTGGWLLILGAVGYFILEWAGTRLSPSWYQSNPAAELWPVQLGIHALTIGLVVGGVVLVALDLAHRGVPATWWWVTAGLLFVGLTISKPAFSAGLIVLAVIALRDSRQRLAAGLLTSGALLWAYVFFAGAHLGDENSRPPVGFERWAALIGLLAMCSGMIAVGWRYAHSADEPAVRTIVT